jgi:lipoprotein-anchoring transpeptidase ErfK/SrfK
MKSKRQAAIFAIAFVALVGGACDQPMSPNGNSTSSQPPAAPGPSAANSNSAGSTKGPEASRTAASDWAVTLPVLDAFFDDPAFTSELKSKLQLTDKESDKLKAIASEATAELRKTAREDNEGDTRTSELRMKAESDIKNTIGDERTKQLFAFVAERWGGGSVTTAFPGAVPPDTRIVVNTPAFRMDVFEEGTLIKSYKIGIGYPEFPLPTGLRQADTIIFNPTWTPPDEPWVEAPGSKVEVGKTVEAGDKRNPLGLLKIPIGLPSLIHGGKSISRIGTFASHGCVGLTDSQAKDFARVLAKLRRVELSDDQIAQYAKKRTETKSVKLGEPVPVELRYETIVVEDGRLQIYRDVYGRDTNTEEHLRAVLQSNGVTLDQLSAADRDRVMTALSQMSRDATGKLAAQDPKTPDANSASNKDSSKDRGKQRTAITRNIKGQKEVAIEIAALKGKGYPAPLNLNAGAETRTRDGSTKNQGAKAKASGRK